MPNQLMTAANFRNGGSAAGEAAFAATGAPPRAPAGAGGAASPGAFPSKTRAFRNDTHRQATSGKLAGNDDPGLIDVVIRRQRRDKTQGAEAIVDGCRC